MNHSIIHDLRDIPKILTVRYTYAYAYTYLCLQYCTSLKLLTTSLFVFTTVYSVPGVSYFCFCSCLWSVCLRLTPHFHLTSGRQHYLPSAASSGDPEPPRVIVDRLNITDFRVLEPSPHLRPNFPSDQSAQSRFFLPAVDSKQARQNSSSAGEVVRRFHFQFRSRIVVCDLRSAIGAPSPVQSSPVGRIVQTRNDLEKAARAQS